LWRAQRQKEVVKNLYAECMALEELLEESVNTLGPDARDILAQIRRAPPPAPAGRCGRPARRRALRGGAGAGAGRGAR
jgi:hypothetical protein